MAREFEIEDDDPHFQLGVEHGYADEPLYRFQEPFYQERYETGYACGHHQRMTERRQQQDQQPPGFPPRFVGPRRPDSWDDFCERMRAKGLDRDR